MKIIQLSDLHITAPGQPLFGADPSDHLERCIASINRDHGDADLCVVTGDLTHDGDAAAYAALTKSLSSLRVPVRLLVGNHDDRAAFLNAFPDTPVDKNGFIQSFHDCSAGRLVFLDTLQPGTAEGRLCEARLDWLREALAGAGGRDAYVFSHHPAFDIALPSMDWIRLAEFTALREIVTRSGNVRHLFSGHVHRPSAGTWHGIPFSTTRGTNHQHALEFDRAGPATTVMEPPGCTVIFIRESGVVVHFHDLLDTSRRYLYPLTH